MLLPDDIVAIARRLLDAREKGAPLEPITVGNAEFGLDDAYAVLLEIERARVAAGWTPVGRKIGFTNRSIWELFGVAAPMWATVWDRTIEFAPDAQATVDLTGLLEPRIEPEVVFKLSAAPSQADDAEEVLRSVEWMAPGFEIVWSPYPGWKFALADSAAAFGLHGRLVVGPPVVLTDDNRASVAGTLATFEATLSRGGEVVDRGVGANVLDSPALALAFLARVVAAQPDQRPLVAGEIITTGTITNAFAVAPDERWTSDYGALGLAGMSIAF